MNKEVKIMNCNALRRLLLSGCIMALFLAVTALIYTGCSKDDEVTTYTVAFETDGGTPVPATQSVEAGKTATAPATNPTKSGYVFLFWHLSGASTAYNFSTPITGNITLQAKWEEESKVEYWQVSWELNGGAWPASGDNHATQVAKGGTLAEPTAPIKTGKIFDGWYKESTLTNKVLFPHDVSSVTGNITLYAKWEDADKAEYFGTWRDSRVEDWDQFTIDADRIVMVFRTGHSITIENLTWTETSNQNEFAADYPTGYEVNGTVTKCNGINFIKEDKSGYAGAGDRVALNVYISGDKKSIVIGIWSIENEGTYGPYYINNVGHWQVTWELNGGAWPSGDNHDVQVAKDGMLRAPASPTKADNNFAGWYTNTALSNLALFPYDASTATNNISFYAKWTDTSPSVTLKVSVSTGAGFYTSITAMRVSLGSPSQYSIPTANGTHTVKVSPGTYRIFYSYWACQTVNCMSSGYSSDFTVSSGQTKNISLVGSAVGF